MKPSDSKPINQRTDAIRLLRADHLADNEFFLELIFAIIDTQKKIEEKNVEDINIEIYDDGIPNKRKLVEYFSDKTNIDKKDLKCIMSTE